MTFKNLLEASILIIGSLIKISVIGISIKYAFLFINLFSLYIIILLIIKKLKGITILFKYQFIFKL